ncbi:MAG: crotonase/enoyl-CoA hydratase family protein [Chloroflexota bacterium]
MSIRIEKNGPVWTVINSRPEARNAVNPENSEALYNAFLEFENNDSAKVAVFWGEGGAFCAGWDLKRVSTFQDDSIDDLTFPENDLEHCQGPMGPSRLELDKPVIAAVAGPAVAGGIELAMWCDFRVMEESAYMGVYCRRWGVPLIDGGTVRLPRLVGKGRALEIILTGRKVPAEECAQIGLCEYVVPEGESRAKAEELAHEIARFPESTMRADRRSAIHQQGLSERDALKYEWTNGREEVKNAGIAGAARFSSGLGRHGDFKEI